MVALEVSAVDVATFCVALAALFVSVFVAGVQTWARFFARPDIWPVATWIEHGKGVILRISIVNTGHRQGVVTDLDLRSARFPHIGQWTTRSLANATPLVLPPDGAAGPFVTELVLNRAKPRERPVAEALQRREDPQIEIAIVEALRERWRPGVERQASRKTTFHRVRPFA